MARGGALGGKRHCARLSGSWGGRRYARGRCWDVHAQKVNFLVGSRSGGSRLGSGCRGWCCNRGSGLGAVCQKLLQHTTQGLHACCVVLVELCLKLAVEVADQLLRSLLVCQEPVCNSCKTLVQVRAKVMSSAVKVLLQRVELCLHVADGLGLFHSGAVLLAQLGFHVLHKGCKPVLQVRWADRVASQIANVSSQSSLHGIHVHA